MVETVVLPPLATSPYQALDIWPAMRAANGEDWDASSYAQWVATIDTKLAGALSNGRVNKKDRGFSSDGKRKIYSYEAGFGTAHVLLVAGLHGDERTAMFAAANWFERFVSSNDPTMALLRKTLKVTWLPAANPSAFGVSRKNSNDVDPNRNFDFYWARFTTPNPMYNKGSAAFSEPESQVIKAIIDEGASCFIDCHNMGVDGMIETMQVQAPSSWVAGKRGLCFSAAEIWAQKYGTSWRDLEIDPDLGNPTGVSWASAYNLWTKNRYNAAAALFECSSNMEGSTATHLTAAAARNYCGLITTFLSVWLGEGQQPARPAGALWYGARSTPADTTPVSAGGTMINDTAQRPLTLDTFGPFASGASKDYLEILFPAPGIMKVYADGYIEGGGEAPRRIDITFAVANRSDLSSYSIDNNAFTSVLVPAGETDRQGFALSSRLTLTSLNGDNRARIKLMMQGPNAGANVKVRRARIWAEFTPSSRLAFTPPCN